MNILHAVVGLGVLFACSKGLPESKEKSAAQSGIYKLKIKDSQLVERLPIDALVQNTKDANQKYDGHLHGEFDHMKDAAIDFCASSRNGHTEGEGFYYSPEFSCNFKSLCICQDGKRKAVVSEIIEVYEFDADQKIKINAGDFLVFMFLNENGSSYPDGINEHFFLIPAKLMSGKEGNALVMETSHWSNDWEF